MVLDSGLAHGASINRDRSRVGGRIWFLTVRGIGQSASQSLVSEVALDEMKSTYPA